MEEQNPKTGHRSGGALEGTWARIWKTSGIMNAALFQLISAEINYEDLVSVVLDFSVMMEDSLPLDKKD